ncbi:MAG: alanine racemase [Ktedonobacteraceae bacterium]
MIHLDLLLKATQGTLRYLGKQDMFPAFSHDTRQIVPSELFVAVRGERNDGHDYLFDALRGGAAGVMVEARVFNALAEETQQRLEHAQVATIIVEDTRVALQHYASFILHHWHPVVIAVTGSVGKTSTKEAIATVLSSKFSTFRSWQNYNDLLGIPLSLGRLEPQHQYAVLELGCDHPGEIAALCRITHPHIGVLTHISPAQLQDFGTLEQLASELGTLLTSLPEGGCFFYNNYNQAIYDLALRRNTLHAQNVARYPYIVHNMPAFTKDEAPSPVQDIQVTWQGVQCSLLTMELTTPETPTVHTTMLTSHLLGEHHLQTMLAAYAIGRHVDMSLDEIASALRNIYPISGRLNPLLGVYNAMLLDDTHNATPTSMSAGLRTLNALPAAQRIAVLGDMLSLGDYAEEAHRIVGREVAQYADYLVVKGTYATLIAESAQQAGLSASHITITATHEDAAQAVRHILEQHSSSSTARDVVLIKGSEATRMERVTELLMAEPWEASEQLVRQTPGWKQIVVARAERPTWVEIDLNAIANNTRRIKSIVGSKVLVLISLKADAYGHGALKVARTTLRNGASMLGVATLSEAAPLREGGITAPILVFGYVPLWQMREAVRQDVTVTLYSSESAQALSHAALALDKTVTVHVKIDTGMGRLGIREEQLDAIVALVHEIKALPGLALEGLYTHFAMADTYDKTYSLQQLKRFNTVLRVLTEQGLRPPLVHASNSAATLSLPEARFDMVRPGIAIYGLDPSPEIRVPAEFRPALAFKTQVAQVKMVPAGECISYGCIFTTERSTRVAVLPVGYADGFRRSPNNWRSVLIHGQEAPILGRVCMDQCMVDVTNIPQTRMGDEVVLIGRQGDATLTAEQVAARLGTINYEVVAEILARVPRVD